MAALQKEMCSSCFRETGYRCILCANPFCNQCSVFEENEDVPGWVMGKSVAYCEHCFEEKWTTTNRATTATTNDDNITDHRSSCDDKSKTDATSSSSSSSKRYVSKCETFSSILFGRQPQTTFKIFEGNLQNFNSHIF